MKRDRFELFLYILGMVCLGIGIAILAKAVQADEYDYGERLYAPYDRQERSQSYGKRYERKRDSGYRYFYSPSGEYQAYEDVPYGHVYDKHHEYRGSFYGD